MSRQHIPPIQCLTTFETLARLRSGSLAADELNVTPSAVTHRIRQLESHLGVKLFGRADFTLTAQGAAYLVNVRSGLDALQRAPGQVPQDGVTKLRVAVTPTFARQMLMPRLPQFRLAYPEIELTLQVAIPLLDVKAEETDLEFRFGTGPYGDVEQLRILGDEVTPVCSPEYLKEFGPFEGFESRREVAQVRLIRSPLEPWSTWFSAVGIGLPEPRDGAQFNDVGLMLDAAACGYGVALLRHRLGAAWLESGRLVALSEKSVPSPHHHFICWKAGALERWECSAFVDWIRQALQ